jgi:hypothetical protein
MANSDSIISNRDNNSGIDKEEKEMEYYMGILCKWDTHTTPLYTFVDDILNGFSGDYSERVPDEFLKQVYRLRNQSVRQIDIDKWIRISPNTDPILRRLYAFWKTKCEGKFIKSSIICFIITIAIDDLCRKWFKETIRNRYHLLWHERNCPYEGTVNENDLTEFVKQYWYQPQRLERLTLEYVKRMLEPLCEN